MVDLEFSCSNVSVRIYEHLGGFRLLRTMGKSTMQSLYFMALSIATVINNDIVSLLPCRTRNSGTFSERLSIALVRLI